MKELLLFLSVSSVLALTVPREEPRAVHNQGRADTSAPLALSANATLAAPGNPQINSTAGLNFTGASLSSNFSTDLPADLADDFSNYTTTLSVCDLGIVECIDDDDSDTDDSNDGDSDGGSGNATVPAVASNMTRRAEQRFVLVKRGERQIVPFREYPTFRLDSQSYYKPFEYYAGPRLRWDKDNYQFRSSTVMNAAVHNTRTLSSTLDTVTEHPMELQTAGQFMDYASRGDPVMRRQFVDKWKSPIKDYNHLVQLFPDWAPAAIRAAGKKGLTFNDVFFHTMGSKANPGPNVMAEAGINGMKADAWDTNNLKAKGTYNSIVSKTLIGQASSNELKLIHKTALGVFNYFNDNGVKRDLVSIRAAQQKLLDNFEELTNEDIYSQNGQAQDLKVHYDEFLQEQIPDIERNAKRWITDFARGTKEAYETKIQMLYTEYQNLRQWENHPDRRTRDKYWNSVDKRKDDQRKVLRQEKDKFADIEDDYNNQYDKVKRINDKVMKEDTPSKRAKVRSEKGWKDQLDRLDRVKQRLQDQGRVVFSARYQYDILTSAGLGDRINGFRQDLQDFDTIIRAGEQVNMPDFTQSFSNLCTRGEGSCTLDEENNKNGKPGAGDEKNPGTEEENSKGGKPGAADEKKPGTGEENSEEGKPGNAPQGAEPETPETPESPKTPETPEQPNTEPKVAEPVEQPGTEVPKAPTVGGRPS